MHAPPLQVSAPLQNRPSLQLAVLFVCWQPAAGLHESSVHTLLSLQSGGGPPAQAPFEHASPVVQALPSSQAVPSAFFGFEHVPVPGSHVPTSWHWSSAVHTTRLVPVHTPP